MKLTKPSASPVFVDANPNEKQSGSIVPAKYINDVQDELINAITASDITPDGDDTTQLGQAISKKIDTDVTPRLNEFQAQLTADVASIDNKIDNKREYITNGTEAKTGYKILNNKDISDVFARWKSVAITYSGSGNIVDSLSLTLNESTKVLTLGINRHPITYCTHCSYCTYCSYCKYDAQCACNCGSYYEAGGE